MRHRLIFPLEDEAMPRPRRGKCGVASLPRSRTGRRGVASFPHGEMSISMVPPDSGRSAYRYPVRPVHIKTENLDQAY
ncbi:hypothetical protein BHE74_00059640 [Ensete ventricosum]|nr:hypothetical protein GW17_00058816 [Ensete ventricosum]RWW35423.1 hypothetical protein BHE74_00059640 [Ensete ventricosum]